MSTALTLEQKLTKFVAKWNKIVQRTPEWYKLVGETIGLSELAAILGQNKYKTVDEVIKDKIEAKMGIFKQIDSPACHWGMVFEDVTSLYMAKYFVSPVVGDDICIQQRAGLRGSPDGYIILNVYDPKRVKYNEKVESINGGAGLVIGGKQIYTIIEDKTSDDFIDTTEIAVLLEFKSPHTRNPGPLNDVYRSQVLGGISLSYDKELDFAINYGMFVDCRYRKCKITDLAFDNPNYDSVYHTTFKKYGGDIVLPQYPKAMGIIYVYSAKPITGLPVDFGASCNFDLILSQIVKKELKIIYGPVHLSITAEQEGVPKFEPNLVEGMNLVGYIPYKMFDIVFTIVEKDTLYLEKIIPVVDEVLFKVNQQYEMGIFAKDNKSQEEINKYFN